MIILGINAYHPDASVALMRDGELVWAAEEERFSRVKHASGFPHLALKHCLEETGTPATAIDVVAISKNPHANFMKKIQFVLKYKPAKRLIFDRMLAFRKLAHLDEDFYRDIHATPGFLKAKFMYVEHHQAHIASSYYFSGYDRAAFLSLDGMGDFSSAMWGLAEENHLRVMDRVFFPHSAGFLYTAATQFLGFHNFGDEYKVMGLAGYGQPKHLETFRHMYHLKRNGGFELNLHYFLHHHGAAKIRWGGGAPEQDIMFSPHWEEKLGRPRLPDEPLTERDKNIAASLQAALEEIYFHVLKHLYEKTKEPRLCLAGGCAFNSVANGKITKATGFREVYIQPAAGDAGTAVGAAAFISHSVFKESKRTIMNHAYFGSEFDKNAIEAAIKASEKGTGQQFDLSPFPEGEIISKTVEALAAGKVVGWFQGKMEFGPRALGARSILADPRRLDMKDILNRRIKHRETFRPFAPAIPEENAKEFFEMDCVSSPFMLKVFPVRPEKRSVIPAVTHVDGTARVQTVSKETNLLFWKLLQAFGKKTGVPILLNTSFNEHEPIVCTPEEAINCFLNTEMDVLVLGSFWIVEKSLT